MASAQFLYHGVSVRVDLQSFDFVFRVDGDKGGSEQLDELPSRGSVFVRASPVRPVTPRERDAGRPCKGEIVTCIV